MADDAQMILHIPEGINFECSGCGNCCFSWPVPLTLADVRRIEEIEELERNSPSPGGSNNLSNLSNLSDLSDLSAGSSSIRKLPSSGYGAAAYTHTLEKRADGRCKFLTESSQCRLHLQYGPDSKPRMCQLFPYTFTPTPSGLYASLSFASSAALYNTGRPLSEQAEFLQSRWKLLEELLPDYRPNWQNIQLADGVPLPWKNYLELEDKLVALLQTERGARLSFSELATELSNVCTSALSPGLDLERNLTDARPKVVDQILLQSLTSFYFPQDVFSESTTDLPSRQIAEKLVKPPDMVPIVIGGKTIRITQLLDNKLGYLTDGTEELLRRFLYCRIFSKLYFGPGFGELSLLAGLHHLLFVVSLARICLKIKFADPACILKPGAERFQFGAELVRILERRLTIARYSREASTIMEVLLSSPSRIQRILSFAA